MTAYGRHSVSTSTAEIVFEIKSVNSKNLDMSIKMPRSLSPLEARVKSAVLAHGIVRGRIDVFISYNRTSSRDLTVSLDEGYLGGYLDALYTLRDKYGLTDDITVMSVASNRDIFRSDEIGEDLDEVWAILLPVLDAAVDEFCAERIREGENLRADLLSKIAHLRTLADKIEELSAADIQGAKERVRARLTAILADNRITVDENRILTECAVWADKIAIDEELVRLRSHFDALVGMAELDIPIGRKFDFQLQETNREINTIGSKCQNAAIAAIVVEMKNEAEKIREQIQNIE
jgi:uncharacterized protein (TIGR00255 family)